MGTRRVDPNTYLNKHVNLNAIPYIIDVLRIYYDKKMDLMDNSQPIK